MSELMVTLRKEKRMSKNSSQYVIRDYIHLPEENIESCKKYIHSKYGISESNFRVEYLKEFPLNDNGKIAYAELLKYVNRKNYIEVQLRSFNKKERDSIIKYY